MAWSIKTKEYPGHGEGHSFRNYCKMWDTHFLQYHKSSRVIALQIFEQEILNIHRPFAFRSQRKLSNVIDGQVTAGQPKCSHWQSSRSRLGLNQIIPSSCLSLPGTRDNPQILSLFQTPVMEKFRGDAWGGCIDACKHLLGCRYLHASPSF